MVRSAAIILAAGLLTTGCQSSGPKWIAKKYHTPMPAPVAPGSEGALALDESKIKPPEKAEPTPQILVDFGRVRASMGQYNEAADLFERALKMEPKNIDAHVGLAQCKIGIGQPEQALSQLQETLKKHPKSARLWNEVGVAHAKLKQYPQAIKAMEKARQLDADSDLYLFNLAGMLAVGGQTQKAIKLYSEKMSTPDAQCEIARIMIGSGNPAEARKYLEAALNENPAHLGARELLAQTSQAPIQPVQYQSQPRNMN